METKVVQKGHQTVERWHGRVAPRTAEVHGILLRKFMEWLKVNGGVFADYTPDELVEYQKEADNGQKYDVLDLVQNWVNKLDLRASSKRRYISAISSLFLHNRAALPKDPTFRIRSIKPRVEGTLTVSEIRDMILSCNKCYRAVYICMFQGGMGLDEVIYWSNNGWAKLREDLRGDPEIIRANLPGRKMRKNEWPYYTLIGPDAIKLLREWVAVRPQDAETLFTNQHGEPISAKSVSTYWSRHLVKLGIITKTENGSQATRYGKNPHEMRDVFRSQWEKSPAKASVAEFLMGHIVDPLFYNKACRDDEWVRGEYLNALPMLQIMSSDTPFGKFDGKTVSKLQGRISELEAIIEEMMPAFRFAQAMVNKEREVDGVVESSREPEDASAKGG